MKLSSQFGKFFQAWKNCLESFKQGNIFLLFLLYAIVQIGFIFILMSFAFPPFSAFLVPIMTKFFGQPSIHYPNNYLVLPTLFFWVNLLLSGFAGILLVGASTNLFARKYQDKSVAMAPGLKTTLPHYSILFVVWIVETAVLLGIFLGLPALMGKIAFFKNHGPLATQLATSLVAIFFGGLFVYTTALIVLENRGPMSAIKKSFGLFWEYPVITFLLLAVPNFIRMPVDLLSGKTQFLITKFNPEMVGIVLMLSVVVSVFANFFLVGTVTRYFMLVKSR